jgi:hypothetical protein
MRRIFVLAALVPFLTACGGGGAPNSRPAYSLPPRQVRIGETPLNGQTVHDGSLAFTPIGYQHLAYFIGSHEEMDPQGVFVRIRIVVENTDRISHTFDYARQLLVTSAGRTYAPDYQAQDVARQPEQVQIGRGDRFEFDVYWDIPVNTKVRAVRFAGDPPSAQGVSVALPG